MFHIRLILVFAASLFMVFGSCTRFHVLGANENEAVAAIAAAEEEIVLCYNAVAEADRAGADATALLAMLEEAGELLSNAALSYSLGDFDSAVSNANQSQDKLKGFVAEVEALAEVATQRYYWDFLVTVIGSVVGTVVIVCGSFVVWHLFKKRYSGGACA